MPKYSEKKRSLAECYTCHTTQGRMYVEIIDRHPRFVCVRHHKVPPMKERV